MLIKGPFSYHRPEDGIQTYTVWVRTIRVNEQLLRAQIGDDGLDAPISGKFLVSVMQVSLHGLNGDAQPVSQFLVTQAGSRTDQYLSFTIGQIREPGGVFLPCVHHCPRNGVDGTAWDSTWFSRTLALMMRRKSVRSIFFRM